MGINVDIYMGINTLNPNENFLAFISIEAHEVVDGKRTGRMTRSRMPVVFYGVSLEIAEQKAREFWEKETAKEQAKKDRAKALGNRKRKAA